MSSTHWRCPRPPKNHPGCIPLPCIAGAPRPTKKPLQIGSRPRRRARRLQLALAVPRARSPRHALLVAASKCGDRAVARHSSPSSSDRRSIAGLCMSVQPSSLAVSQTFPPAGVAALPWPSRGVARAVVRAGGRPRIVFRRRRRAGPVALSSMPGAAAWYFSRPCPTPVSAELFDAVCGKTDLRPRHPKQQ